MINLESKDMIHLGVWAFLIIYLIGIILGRLDGFFLLIFFILAVSISFAVEYYVPRWRTASVVSRKQE